MTWLKVDDQFTDHPKVLALGRDRLAGIGLWAVGSCYAARFLTDGYIPAAVLPPGARRLAQRLVAVGLWDTAEGGYRIHDYHDYQPRRETVMVERRRNAERQARLRDRSNGVTNGATNGVSTGAPTRPVPTNTPEPPNPHDFDDLEVLADGLLMHPATPNQLRAVRTLDRKVGRPRTLEIMRTAITSEVDDRFGWVLDQLGQEASAKRKSSEFDYMDEQSA